MYKCYLSVKGYANEVHQGDEERMEGERGSVKKVGGKTGCEIVRSGGGESECV